VVGDADARTGAVRELGLQYVDTVGQSRHKPHIATIGAHCERRRHVAAVDVDACDG
jgi:hypothetical protein